MADFFAKGNKPINGYGGAQHGVVELWVNTSPTSAFAGQTLNIATDRTYDAIILDYGEVVNSNYRAMGMIMVEIGAEARPSYTYITGAGRVGMLFRDFTPSISGSTLSIVISDCSSRTITNYNSAPTSSTANEEIIPYRILGLIHND